VRRRQRNVYEVAAGARNGIFKRSIALGTERVYWTDSRNLLGRRNVIARRRYARVIVITCAPWEYRPFLFSVISFLFPLPFRPASVFPERFSAVSTTRNPKYRQRGAVDTGHLSLSLSLRETNVYSARNLFFCFFHTNSIVLKIESWSSRYSKRETAFDTFFLGFQRVFIPFIVFVVSHVSCCYATIENLDVHCKYIRFNSRFYLPQPQIRRVKIVCTHDTLCVV